MPKSAAIPGAPKWILRAEARLKAWRPFAKHTAKQEQQHWLDRKIVEEYSETRRKAFEASGAIGADPLGDE